VSESLRPGASPTQVARRYGSRQVFSTVAAAARSGELALVPMAPPAPALSVEIVSEASGCVWRARRRVMVIELAGDRRVRVDRHVDTDALPVFCSRSGRQRDRLPAGEVFLACGRTTCAKAWTLGDAGSAVLQQDPSRCQFLLQGSPR